MCFMDYQCDEINRKQRWYLAKEFFTQKVSGKKQKKHFIAKTEKIFKYKEIEKKLSLQGDTFYLKKDISTNGEDLCILSSSTQLAVPDVEKKHNDFELMFDALTDPQDSSRLYVSETIWSKALRESLQKDAPLPIDQVRKSKADLVLYNYILNRNKCILRGVKSYFSSSYHFEERTKNVLEDLFEEHFPSPPRFEVRVLDRGVLSFLKEGKTLVMGAIMYLGLLPKMFNFPIKKFWIFQDLLILLPLIALLILARSWIREGPKHRKKEVVKLKQAIDDHLLEFNARFRNLILSKLRKEFNHEIQMEEKKNSISDLEKNAQSQKMSTLKDRIHALDEAYKSLDTPSDKASQTSSNDNWLSENNKELIKEHKELQDQIAQLINDKYSLKISEEIISNELKEKHDYLKTIQKKDPDEKIRNEVKKNQWEKIENKRVRRLIDLHEQNFQVDKNINSSKDDDTLNWNFPFESLKENLKKEKKHEIQKLNPGNDRQTENKRAINLKFDAKDDALTQLAKTGNVIQYKTDIKKIDGNRALFAKQADQEIEEVRTKIQKWVTTQKEKLKHPSAKKWLDIQQITTFKVKAWFGKESPFDGLSYIVPSIFNRHDIFFTKHNFNDSEIYKKSISVFVKCLAELGDDYIKQSGNRPGSWKHITKDLQVTLNEKLKIEKATLKRRIEKIPLTDEDKRQIWLAVLLLHSAEEEKYLIAASRRLLKDPKHKISFDKTHLMEKAIKLEIEDKKRGVNEVAESFFRKPFDSKELNKLWLEKRKEIEGNREIYKKDAEKYDEQMSGVADAFGKIWGGAKNPLK